VGLAAGAVAIMATGAFRAPKPPVASAEVRRDAVRIWSAYDGYVEARNVRNVGSGIAGVAAIVELVAEGTSVKAGDVIARMDSSEFDREVVRLEKEASLGKAELEGLTSAQLPLELREIEMRLLQAQTDLATEQQYLADSRELLGDGLISDAEVKKQEQKTGMVDMQSKNLEQQLSLTRDHLHPSKVDHARAALSAAERELAMAREQVDNCSLRAPQEGVVVYRPVHVGGDFRTVRVGDSIYRNQPFLSVHDMSDLVVHLDVPESELPLVQPGMSAEIRPVAFPELRLEGRVETVGSVAQSVENKPSWQKYFHVVVSVSAPDPRLRSGMSVTASVLTADEENAVVIPRAAVAWRDAEAYCRVVVGGKTEERKISLGRADAGRVIVLGGLEPGERVAVD